MSIFKLINNRRRSHLSGRKTGWIGIDIGSGAIKIAQVERIIGRHRITRSVIVRAPDGIPYNRAAIEDGRVSDEIRDAIRTHGGFVGPSAACVISMSECELRTLISAKGSEDEQRELISLELQQDVAHAAEPREFDFWDGALEQQDSGKGMTQVHVMSVPRSLADGLGTAIVDAGLRCEVMDTVPLCGMRAAEMNGTAVASEQEFFRTQAILDWGYSSATLIVVHDGQPILARCLRNCGSSVLCSRIADRLKLTRSQTDALLMNCGVQNRPRENGASEESGELRNLIVELAAPLLHDISQELMETFDFIRLQLSDQSIEQIIVSGVGGAIPGMTRQLAAMLRLPVHPWQLPLRSSVVDQPEPILANAAALSALAWEL